MAKIDEGALTLFYQYQIKGQHGNIKKSRVRRSDSYVKQFIQVLYSMASMVDSIVMKDTSNVDQTITWNGYPTFYVPGQAGVTGNGILIGTGTTAVTINDYAMETLIDHGTGAGEMQYAALTRTAPVTDVSGTSFRLSRVFSNDSGGSITVEEIGVVVNCIFYILIIRDVLGASAITVANGEELTLNYTIKTTV